MNSTDLINRFAGLNVLVVGEAMLDSYLQGFTDRLCPEAPVPVVTLANRQDIPGGAANTAVNVHSLGADVTLLSVIGDDWEGTLLRQALADRGVLTNSLLTQLGRQTLAKQRVMTGSQMLIRLDQGSTQAITSETEQRLIDCLIDLFPSCDAIIVSDYGYGILTKRLIQTLTKLQGQCPRTLVVDARTLSAYRHVRATAVKPNYAEAVQLLGLIPPPAAPSLVRGEGGISGSTAENGTSSSRTERITLHGEQLLDKTGAQIVAVTLDAEGALVFEQGSQPYRTYAQPASDACAIGAGDTFISTFALTLAAGGQTATAAELASAAAAIVVGKDGTAACRAEELCSLSILKGNRCRAGLMSEEL